MEKENTKVELANQFFKRDYSELSAEEKELRDMIGSLANRERELLDLAGRAQKALSDAQGELIGVRHSLSTLVQLAGNREESRASVTDGPKFFKTGEETNKAV